MKNSSRIYGFDALRATAMWLGVILHTVIFFKQKPENSWPHDTQLYSPALEFIYEFIHSFRMPLFFLVAGYFAALVCDRKGLTAFLRQRAGRILVPFLVGAIVLVPLTLLPFHFFRIYYTEHTPLQEAIQRSLKQMLSWNGLAHLWFLYYLLIFYVFSAILFRINKKIKLKVPAFIARPASILLLSVAVLYAIRYTFKFDHLPTYTGYKIPAGLFILYSFFYFSGWVLYNLRFDFSLLSRWSFPLLLVAIISSAVLFIIIPDIPSSLYYLLIVVQCLSTMYACIALFLRYFNKDSAFWRYFSDSSYWVYLLHLGVATFTQVLLHPLAINPWIKMTVVFLVTFIVCLLSYQYLVSNTFIGKALNGKKIPRSGPFIRFFPVRKQKPERAVPD